MNIFEKATRQALRFPSSKGQLSVEQVWDLPLTQLDLLAQSAYKLLQEAEGVSFIERSATPEKAIFALRLDILKHIIDVRQKENAAKLEAKKRADRKTKLLDILASKQDEKLGAMSEADILKELETLD